MGPKQARSGIDSYALGIIRFKARQLVGKSGFDHGDKADIEQDLTLDLVRRMPRFDGAKAGQRTFVDRVVNHGVATLLEAQRAGVRDYRRRAGSLDDPAFRWNEPSIDGEEQLGRRVDVARALQRLPREDQMLLERLVTQSDSEIARATGMPRSRISELRAHIRRRFERAGLRDYA